MSNIQELNRTHLLLFIKICVGIIGCLVLYHQYNESINTVNFSEYALDGNTLMSFGLILGIFSFFNWFGEILKWKILSNPMSLFESAKQVVISHSLSVFTPNKFGEYGGKCMFYPINQSHKVIANTSIGHICQFGVTIIFGIIGLILIPKIPIVELNQSYLWLVPLIFCGFVMVLLNKKLTNHLVEILHNINQINKLVFSKVFFYSIFRYLIFSHQFIFLLWILNAEIQYIDGLSIIFVTYFFSSLIPSFALADTLVKGSMAVTLFSVLGQPHHSVILIVFTMWLCNTMFPAILGYMLLFKWKPEILLLKA